MTLAAWATFVRPRSCRRDMPDQLELELEGGQDDGMYSELELVIRSSASHVLALTRKRPRVVAPNVHSVVAGAAAARASFQTAGTTEYAKHEAFRRDNGLLDTDGQWTRSAELDALELPCMSHRTRDLLHIIWQLFKRRGVRAHRVEQAWMLCQSIYRGRPPFPAGMFRGMVPQIPGLHLLPRGRHVHRALVPCVLPRGKLWLNQARRFARGAETLQFQGVHVPTSSPLWTAHVDGMLKHVAGNVYTIPIVGWYVLLSILAMLPRECLCGQREALAKSAMAQAAAKVVAAPLGLQPHLMAQALLHVLLQRWPEALLGWIGPTSISVGSLCSGADYVKDFSQVLVAEINSLPGTPPLTLRNHFACEIDRKVWALGSSRPEQFYPDVHKLPLRDIDSVDICLISAMCSSISRCNNNRRGLWYADPTDPAQASGATIASSLKYAVEKKPKVVIMENLAAIADAARGSGNITMARDVDLVLSRLRVAGYICGYDVQDAANWWMPQTRRRVYIWAHLPDLPGAVVFGDGIRRTQASGHIPLSACLTPPVAEAAAASTDG